MSRPKVKSDEQEHIYRGEFGPPWVKWLNDTCNSVGMKAVYMEVLTDQKSAYVVFSPRGYMGGAA